MTLILVILYHEGIVQLQHLLKNNRNCCDICQTSTSNMIVSFKHILHCNKSFQKTFQNLDQGTFYLKLSPGNSLSKTQSRNSLSKTQSRNSLSKSQSIGTVYPKLSPGNSLSKTQSMEQSIQHLVQGTVYPKL